MSTLTQDAEGRSGSQRCINELTHEQEGFMRISTLATLMISAGLLSACGGGLWLMDDEPAAAAETPTAAETPSTPSADAGAVTETKPAGLTLSGVVAQGAALAGASVSVKCATGASTATSNADGSYTITVTGGAFPCILEAEAADKSLKLHSAVAADTGTSQVTANVTPLTTLLVAQVVGTEPAAFFADATAVATLAAAVTPTKLDEGQTAVITTLKAAGIDTAAITNMVSQPLVAASGTAAGNGYDKLLDAVTSTLKDSGTTLATLTATVAQASPVAKPPAATTSEDATTSSTPTSSSTSTTTATTTATSPLPADLLLKPKAATCDSLRSTTYRMVIFMPRSAGVPEANDTVAATNTAVVDAKALTFTWSGQSTPHQWQTHPVDKCRFISPGNGDIVISPAGVMVGRLIRTENGVRTPRIAMGFPEQTIPVKDLAGKWNNLDWDWTSADKDKGEASWTRQGSMSTFELAADGTVTTSACASDTLSTPLASCKSEPGLSKLGPNTAGGFNVSSTVAPFETFQERVFAYRAGNGGTMLLGTDAHGHAYFSTRVRTNTLPAVGFVSTSYGFNLNAALQAPDLVSGTQWTATSVDSAAGTYVRSSLTVGRAANTAVPQTIAINKSRNGYSYRQPGTATALDGTSATVREFYALSLAGMGVSAVILPRTNAEPNLSNGILSISVTPPEAKITGTVRGDSLRELFVSGTSYDDRVFAYLNTTGTGIQGAWSLSPTGSKLGQTFFFLSNGEYVMLDPVGEPNRAVCVGTNNPSGGGPAGIEHGTYAFSGVRLTVGTPFTDTNGCAGLHDAQTPSNSTQGTTWTFAADGRSATVTWNGPNPSTDTVYRLPR